MAGADSNNEQAWFISPIREYTIYITQTHTYIHTYIHTYTSIHTNTHMHTNNINNIHTYIHMYTYLHVYMSYMHIYIHIHPPVYTHQYINKHSHIHIPTYVHVIYIHTHIRNVLRGYSLTKRVQEGTQVGGIKHKCFVPCRLERGKADIRPVNPCISSSQIHGAERVGLPIKILRR